MNFRNRRRSGLSIGNTYGTVTTLSTLQCTANTGELAVDTVNIKVPRVPKRTWRSAADGVFFRSSQSEPSLFILFFSVADNSAAGHQRLAVFGDNEGVQSRNVSTFLFYFTCSLARSMQSHQFEQRLVGVLTPAWASATKFLCKRAICVSLGDILTVLVVLVIEVGVGVEDTITSSHFFVLSTG